MARQCKNISYFFSKNDKDVGSVKSLSTVVDDCTLKDRSDSSEQNNNACEKTEEKIENFFLSERIAAVDKTDKSESHSGHSSDSNIYNKGYEIGNFFERSQKLDAIEPVFSERILVMQLQKQVKN